MNELPKRRRSYSVKEKLKYLEDFEAGLLDGTIRTLAEFANNYSIPYGTIRYWNRFELEEKLRQNKSDSRKDRPKNIGLWVDVENELYEWYDGVRRRRLPVAVKDLRQKGLELFQQWW